LEDEPHGQSASFREQSSSPISQDHYVAGSSLDQLSEAFEQQALEEGEAALLDDTVMTWSLP
jgi:hypothetical protein